MTENTKKDKSKGKKLLKIEGNYVWQGLWKNAER
jgi:hypothetical protein